MENELTKLDVAMFVLLAVVLIFTVISTIFGMINYFFSIDLMTTGIEMTGEVIYQVIH